MLRRYPITVVLTAATSGIGRATALVLARRGASLVLAARDEAALDEVAEECRQLGGHATTHVTDVTNPASVHSLARAAIEHFGRVDVWINMVGTAAVGRLEEVPVDAHRRVVEASLLGHLYGAHAILPHFRHRQRGILINMNSIGGWLPTPYAASYAASKFGLRAFAQALRAEVADQPGIHICEVYPVMVDTAGLSHAANYTGKRLRAVPPTLDPFHVADRIVQLIDAPRPYITIGSLVWPARIAHALAPNLTLRITRALIDAGLRRAETAPKTEGNVFEPTRDPRIRGGFQTANRKSLTTPLLLVIGAGIAGMLLGRRLH